MHRLLLIVVVTLLATNTADARRRRGFQTSDYSSYGTFGLGLELGSPSGLNGKYFLSSNTALNFGVGYIYDRYWHDGRDGVHLYLDHLWHPFVLGRGASLQIPFYVGVGGRLWSFNHKNDDGFALGVRVPVGLAFELTNVPLDFFVQLTAVADALFRHDDRLGVHLEGSIGIRFWFD